MLLLRGIAKGEPTARLARGEAALANAVRLVPDDPDVMRSMFTALPDMIAAMPGAFERLEKETAHLPKPKPKKKAEEKAKSGLPKG